MQLPPDGFPFKTAFNLRHLVDYWRETADDDASPRAVVARTMLERLDDAPELLEPITDPAVLDRHRDLLDLMMSVIIPAASLETAIIWISPPFDMRPYYATPRFEQLQLFNKGCPERLPYRGVGRTVPFDTIRASYAYYWILTQFYGVEMPAKSPPLFSLTDEATGLDQYFGVDINTRFASIKQNGPLPDLSDDDIEALLADPMNLSLWESHLPPELFEPEGFVVLTATDVTDPAVLSALKDDLLQKDAMASPERIVHLQRRLRTLMRRADLELGLICLSKDDIEGITAAQAIGRSLLLGEHGAPACPHKSASYYAQAYAREEPLVVNDLKRCETCTGFEARLLEQNVRTLVLAPLRYEGKLVGLLELGSPHPHAVNTFTLLKLGEVTALFATAMKRMLDEHEDRVQAVIKENYTAIHPAVEWRFRDTAAQYLLDREEDSMRQIQPIVFHDVYPLYGLSDIRSSSTHRSAAIQADLLEQLGLALNVIVEAAIDRPLPILDEISYRVSQYAERIGPGASTEDETSVLDFLKYDVEPLFERLQRFGPRVQERITRYNQALDPDLGVLYNERRAYEESVTRINDTIGAYLDTQEAHAQAMFPHYFEKFKTDGVDYNVYIGASLVEDPSTFDLLYLRNMRLWQLMTTCGVEWELRRLKPSLPMPLDATHLILVQSAPLSIRFRMEEKQFDVDGAYNIRYEIVKKRIDKAVIRDTGERLTQPGKIAIVYAQTREAQEYERYLEFLSAAGYITDEIESFELEAMQGVHGLKALRVTVHPEAPERDVSLTSPDHHLTDAEVLIPS